MTAPVKAIIAKLIGLVAVLAALGAAIPAFSDASHNLQSFQAASETPEQRPAGQGADITSCSYCQFAADIFSKEDDDGLKDGAKKGIASTLAFPFASTQPPLQPLLQYPGQSFDEAPVYLATARLRL